MLIEMIFESDLFFHSYFFMILFLVQPMLSYPDIDKNDDADLERLQDLTFPPDYLFSSCRLSANMNGLSQHWKSKETMKHIRKEIYSIKSSKVATDTLLEIVSGFAQTMKHQSAQATILTLVKTTSIIMRNTSYLLNYYKALQAKPGLMQALDFAIQEVVNVLQDPLSKRLLFALLNIQTEEIEDHKELESIIEEELLNKGDSALLQKDLIITNNVEDNETASENMGPSNVEETGFKFEKYLNLEDLSTSTPEGQEALTPDSFNGRSEHSDPNLKQNRYSKTSDSDIKQYDTERTSTEDTISNASVYKNEEEIKLVENISTTSANDKEGTNGKMLQELSIDKENQVNKDASEKKSKLKPTTSSTVNSNLNEPRADPEKTSTTNLEINTLKEEILLQDAYNMENLNEIQHIQKSMSSGTNSNELNSPINIVEEKENKLENNDQKTNVNDDTNILLTNLKIEDDANGNNGDINLKQMDKNNTTDVPVDEHENTIIVMTESPKSETLSSEFGPNTNLEIITSEEKTLYNDAEELSSDKNDKEKISEVATTSVVEEDKSEKRKYQKIDSKTNETLDTHNNLPLHNTDIAKRTEKQSHTEMDSKMSQNEPDEAIGAFTESIDLENPPMISSSTNSDNYLTSYSNIVTMKERYLPEEVDMGEESLNKDTPDKEASINNTKNNLPIKEEKISDIEKNDLDIQSSANKIDYNAVDINNQGEDLSNKLERTSKHSDLDTAEDKYEDADEEHTNVENSYVGLKHSKKDKNIVSDLEVTVEELQSEDKGPLNVDEIEDRLIKSPMNEEIINETTQIQKHKEIEHENNIPKRGVSTLEQLEENVPPEITSHVASIEEEDTNKLSRNIVDSDLDSNISKIPPSDNEIDNSETTEVKRKSGKKTIENISKVEFTDKNDSVEMGSNTKKELNEVDIISTNIEGPEVITNPARTNSENKTAENMNEITPNIKDRTAKEVSNSATATSKQENDDPLKTRERVISQVNPKTSPSQNEDVQELYASNSIEELNLHKTEKLVEQLHMVDNQAESSDKNSEMPEKKLFNEQGIKDQSAQEKVLQTEDDDSKLGFNFEEKLENEEKSNNLSNPFADEFGNLEIGMSEEESDLDSEEEIPIDRHTINEKKMKPIKESNNNKYEDNEDDDDDDSGIEIDGFPSAEEENNDIESIEMENNGINLEPIMEIEHGVELESNKKIPIEDPDTPKNEDKPIHGTEEEPMPKNVKQIQNEGKQTLNMSKVEPKFSNSNTRLEDEEDSKMSLHNVEQTHNSIDITNTDEENKNIDSIGTENNGINLELAMEEEHDIELESSENIAIEDTDRQENEDNLVLSTENIDATVEKEEPMLQQIKEMQTKGISKDGTKPSKLNTELKNEDNSNMNLQNIEKTSNSINVINPDKENKDKKSTEIKNNSINLELTMDKKPNIEIESSMNTVIEDYDIQRSEDKLIYGTDNVDPTLGKEKPTSQKVEQMQANNKPTDVSKVELDPLKLNTELQNEENLKMSLQYEQDNVEVESSKNSAIEDTKVEINEDKLIHGIEDDEKAKPMTQNVERMQIEDDKTSKMSKVESNPSKLNTDFKNEKNSEIGLQNVEQTYDGNSIDISNPYVSNKDEMSNNDSTNMENITVHEQTEKNSDVEVEPKEKKYVMSSLINFKDENEFKKSSQDIEKTDYSKYICRPSNNMMGNLDIEKGAGSSQISESPIEKNREGREKNPTENDSRQPLEISVEANSKKLDVEKINKEKLKEEKSEIEGSNPSKTAETEADTKTQNVDSEPVQETLLLEKEMNDVNQVPEKIGKGEGDPNTATENGTSRQKRSGFVRNLFGKFWQ